MGWEWTTEWVQHCLQKGHRMTTNRRPQAAAEDDTVDWQGAAARESIAYKALHNTELHMKHYNIRNVCRVSVFISAYISLAKIP